MIYLLILPGAVLANTCTGSSSGTYQVCRCSEDIDNQVHQVESSSSRKIKPLRPRCGTFHVKKKGLSASAARGKMESGTGRQAHAGIDFSRYINMRIGGEPP